MAKKPTPRPGAAVRGSTSGRPLMAAFDLLGRRWSLRILWELRDGPLGARRILQECDGLSSSVLYDRLAELRDTHLVEQGDDDAYRLTELGLQLRDALRPLSAWSEEWARQLG